MPTLDELKLARDGHLFWGPSPEQRAERDAEAERNTYRMVFRVRCWEAVRRLCQGSAYFTKADVLAALGHEGPEPLELAAVLQKAERRGWCTASGAYKNLGTLQLQLYSPELPGDLKL